MIDTEKVKNEIEAAFEDAVNKGNELIKSLNTLRTIGVEFDKDNQEELQMAMGFGRDIDARTAFILRSILIQHGNVLFL